MPSLTLMHFAHKAMSTASMVMLPVLPSPSFVRIDVVVCAVLDRRTLAMGSRNGLFGWVMLGRLLRCQHWSCREFLHGGSQLLPSS